jgi:O-antigen/teichoic acid export membrane protein
MGIVFRQTIKTTGVIFTGAVLGAAITLIQAKVFPQNQLGASRNLLNQGAVLYLFLLMGTLSVVHTFAQRYDENDPRRPVLITFSMMVPIAATLLFCIPYFLLEEFIVAQYNEFDQPYIREFFPWLPVLGVLWSFMAMLEYYLISRMKVAVANLNREIILRLANIALIALFYARLIDFHLFVVGTVLVHVIPVAILFYLSTRTKGFHISFDWQIFSREDIRSIIHYAWYHMLLTVSLNLTGMLDILLLGMLSPNGLSDVAIYNIALFLISLLTIPYRAMTGAAFPRLNASFVNNDGNLESLFTRSAINIQLVSVGMWLIIACNLHNAVAVFRNEYAAFAPCFLILSIGRMVDMFTGLNTELISITNYYKFTSRLSAVLMFSILLFGWIFIPKFGLFGAAWVSTGTLVAFNLIKMGFLYQKMRLSPFTKQTGIIILCGAATYAVIKFLPALGNAIADAFVRSTCILAVYGLLMLLLRPSPDLSAFLAQVRKDKRLF